MWWHKLSSVLLFELAQCGRIYSVRSYSSNWCGAVAYTQFGITLRTGLEVIAPLRVSKSTNRTTAGAAVRNFFICSRGKKKLKTRVPGQDITPVRRIKHETKPTHATTRKTRSIREGGSWKLEGRTGPCVPSGTLLSSMELI